MPKELSSSVRIFYPKFDKETLIGQLKENLEKLNQEIELFLVVLFGSYAKEKFTVASDIDLLVVYEGKERLDAFSKTKKILDVPLLEPHVYSKEQYKNLKKIIDKMVAKGEVLFFKT